MTQASAAVLSYFWPEDEERTIWGVYDCARNREIYGHLLNSYMEYVCLYAGNLPDELERNSPHLVRLEANDRSAQELVQKGWGKSWGIFAEFRGHISDIRKHFRHLLLAQDHQGTRLLFRYYDPRILRAYLPTCTRNELQEVFGPVQCYWVESAVPGQLLAYTLWDGKLRVEKVNLG